MTSCGACERLEAYEPILMVVPMVEDVVSMIPRDEDADATIVFVLAPISFLLTTTTPK